MIFDTHLHYNLPPLFDEWKKHWQEAQNHGVGASIVVGTDEDTSAVAVKIASESTLYCAVGYHPHDGTQVSQEKVINSLRALVESSKKVVAIGECGLDYSHHPNDQEKNAQHVLFRTQISLAAKLKLPLIIHCRDAQEDMLAMLEEHKPKAVLHCMSGSPQYLAQALKLGFFISFAGNVTYKNAHSLRELAQNTPLDRLLVETDAPFLSPEPYRGQVNEPWHIVETVKTLAELHRISPDDIATRTYDNACAFFSIS